MTNFEVQELLQWGGGPLVEDEAWVATYRVTDYGLKVKKDWIQIGTHFCGIGCSHFETFGDQEWATPDGDYMMMAFNKKK